MSDVSSPSPAWPGLGRWALALVLAPMLLASLLTLLAFLAAGSTEATRDDVLSATRFAAVWLFGGLLAFSLVCGSAGVALLRTVRARGPLAWAAMGAALGAGLAILLGLARPLGIVPIQVAVAAGLGWVLFELIRRLAGVRRP